MSFFLRFARRSAVFALAIAVCSTTSLRAEDAKAVHAWLKSKGAFVETDDRGEVQTVRLDDIMVQGDQAVQVKWSDADLLRLKPLKSLTYLSLAGATFSADGLAKLEELPALEELNLTAAFDGSPAKQFNETHFKGIGQVKRLKSLQIDSGNVTTLEPLAGLSQLEKLQVPGAKLNDAGFKPVAGLKNLKHLIISDSQITDLAPLAGLANLEVLEMAGAPITDAGFKPIAGLKNLKQLKLMNAKISDTGLAALAGLTELREVGLAGTNIADLKPLAGLVKLEQLGLARTKIDDADLKHLAGLKSLHVIGLERTDISDISVLAQLPNLGTVYLENTKIDDDDLQYLTHLKGETGEVTISAGTKVTEKGAEKLRKLYPKKYVE